MLRSINARHLLLDKFLTTAVSLGLDELVGLEDSPPSSQSSLPDSPQVPERLHLPGLSSLPPSSPASPSLGQGSKTCIIPTYFPTNIKYHYLCLIYAHNRTGTIRRKRMVQ